tara:strand:- start:2854 stop:3225 length:372 start_codon:yes stop_codon:yes gene_type:complete
MAKLSGLISVEHALKLFDGVGVLVRLFDLGSQKKVFRRLCLDLSSSPAPASSVIVFRLEFVDAKHWTRCALNRLSITSVIGRTVELNRKQMKQVLIAIALIETALIILGIYYWPTISEWFSTF